MEKMTQAKTDKDRPASSRRHQALIRAARHTVKNKFAKKAVFSIEALVMKLRATASKDKAGVEMERPSDKALEAWLRYIKPSAPAIIRSPVSK
jgi:hypothetical protein